MCLEEASVACAAAAGALVDPVFLKNPDIPAVFLKNPDIPGIFGSVSYIFSNIA